MKQIRTFSHVSTILLVLGAFATTTLAYGATDSDVRKVTQQAKGAQNNNANGGLQRRVTLTNATDKPLSNIRIKFSGKDPDDFKQTNNCGGSLVQQKSCTINVTFLPKTPGDKSATLEVLSSEGVQTVALTGMGI